MMCIEISTFTLMGRLNKMVVKKMTDDSPEYMESNLWIVNGTAEDLCREIYESRKLAMLLSGGKYNIKQPLNKNFVKKTNQQIHSLTYVHHPSNHLRRDIGFYDAWV